MNIYHLLSIRLLYVINFFCRCRSSDRQKGRKGFVAVLFRSEFVEFFNSHILTQNFIT